MNSWYASLVNYLAASMLPDCPKHHIDKLKSEAKFTNGMILTCTDCVLIKLLDIVCLITSLSPFCISVILLHVVVTLVLHALLGRS